MRARKQGVLSVLCSFVLEKIGAKSKDDYNYISFYSECGSNLGPLSAINIYNKLEAAAKNRPTNLIT